MSRFPEAKSSTILIGMLAYNLSLLVIPLMLLAETPLPADAGSLSEPIAPHLTRPQMRFLSRLARRTLNDAAMNRPNYEPSYVPAELESLEIEVIVRLREKGYLRAAGAGGPAPVAIATRDAVLQAFDMLRQDQPSQRRDVQRLLVEIEAVGAATPIDITIDWTRPRAVDPFVEPGVHGMALQGARAYRRFCPSELIVSDLVLAEALKRLAQHMHSDSSQVTNTKLLRFRTTHWYQPAPGAPIVSLHRGLTLVPPEAVSADGLDDSIARIAEYMAYRQRPSGLFAYEYQPSLDVYSESDNLVRQAGAAWAMAWHARYSGTSASRGAADAAIRHHLKGLTDISDSEKTAFIATSDGRNKLGLTALLTLAMAAHPDASRFAEVREKLVNGMLWLQRPSGMFVTAFPPAERIDAQEYFPGEALLALAREYELHPSARILEAFDRAIGFYRAYFRGSRSPAFVPWQVQAYVLMAQHTRRSDYVEYVFELTDWLAERQLNESNCPWPELWGGVAAHQPGRVGVATASYLEGFADALRLAQTVGDRDRARRYEKVVRAAARFVMQLQVRPEEAYFIRSPQDAVGGIRTTPSLNLLRIDHCQHALIALMKTRRVLYPQ